MPTCAAKKSYLDVLTTNKKAVYRTDILTRWQPFPYRSVLVWKYVPTSLVSVAIVILPERVIVKTKLPDSSFNEATVSFMVWFHPIRAGESNNQTPSRYHGKHQAHKSLVHRHLNCSALFEMFLPVNDSLPVESNMTGRGVDGVTCSSIWSAQKIATAKYKLVLNFLPN